jgi:atypical dual specificity phosphatase
MTGEKLNFSWLAAGEVAGHSAPISSDDLKYLKSNGIKALVRMAEGHKVQITPDDIKKLGFTDCYVPVPDFTAPRQYQLNKMVAFISKSVAQGKPVGVSCGEGIGRTGTVLACYLVSKCHVSEQAMEEVKQKRGTEIETEDQKQAVRRYAELLGKQ